jgi:competence protein ComEC
LLRQLGYRPLVLGAIGLAAGIAATDALELSFSLALLVLCGALAAFSLLLGGMLRGTRLLLGVAFFSLGLFLHSLHSVLPPDHISHSLPVPGGQLVGRLLESPGDAPHGRRLLLQAELLNQGRSWQAARGRVVLFQPGLEPTVLAGDRLLVQVKNLQAPRRPANPGQFDARRFYLRRGVCARGTAEGVAVEPGPRPAAGRLAEFVAAQQQAALAALERAMPGDNPAYYAGLLGGMVYGQRAAGPVSEDTQDLFRRTGTIHLLVVSGAQITFIIFALILLVSGRGRWALQPWHLLLIFPPMLAFSVFAGIAGSVTRALVMAGVLAYALVSHREYDPYSALGLAALVLMLADTNALFDEGTQLTFAACLGVILFVPRARLDEWTGRRVRPPLLASVFWGSVGAWALTTPIVVASFHGLPLLGNLANLLAVPLSMLIMPLGMIALLTGAWLLSVTTALCWLCRLLIGLMLAANRFCQALPGAYVDVVYFGPRLTLGWYVVVAGGLLLVARPDLRRRIASRLRVPPRDRLFLAVGGLAAVAVAVAAVHMARPPWLRLTVLAVGEGACFLVQTPDGHAMMVDAGASGSGAGTALADDTIVPYLARRGVRRLDYFLLTHGDADHCNALDRLLHRVQIKRYLDPLLGGEPTYQQGLLDVERRGIPITRARAGEEMALGSAVSALLVAPSEPLLAGTGADENNNSAAVLLRYGATRLLLTGDQQEAGLERLVAWAGANAVPLAAQVVVLPHHGRSARWCGELLRQTGAKWAVVSGERGPPARRELGGLSAVVSTGESGAIEVISDGREVRVRVGIDE